MSAATTQPLAPTPGPPLAIDTSAIVGVPEVLAATRKSQATLYRWIRKKKFPSPVEGWPGKERVWRRADVEAFFGRTCASAAG